MQARRIRKPLYLTAVTTGIVAMLMPWAYALFSDSDSVTGNSFDTGTISLSTSPTSALVTFTDMFPGDSVTAELTVSNGGSGELRYAMTSSVTDTTLSGGLSLDVKSGLSTCSSAAMDDGALGTVVFDGTLSAAAFGDPTQGAQAGDRTLAAGASEKLCFKVLLPLDASNTLQGLTTSATPTFASEQTKNNP